MANDGYKLWLQYYPVENPNSSYKTALTSLDITGNSPTLDIIKKEIKLLLKA
jgi:alpha-glucuronidase